MKVHLAQVYNYMHNLVHDCSRAFARIRSKKKTAWHQFGVVSYAIRNSLLMQNANT
jgi:hypothetical protein